MSGSVTLLFSILIALALFLMMQRNLIRIVVGMSILSNAVNLLLLSMGRVTRGSAPLIPPEGEEPIQTLFVNPLPQALILTAIVINFGILSFMLVLVYRNFKDGNESLDE